MNILYQFHSKGFPQTLPLQLWLFGVNYLQEPVRRPQGVPYYQWFFCAKGSGELILGQKRSVISKGQGFLIYPDEPHIYQGLMEDWHLHIVAFNGPLCPNLLPLLQMKESGAYHFSDPTVFEQHVQRLLWLYQNRSADQTLAYSKECYDFLLDLSRCITRIHKFSTSQEHPVVLKITSWLEENYQRPISLDELADVLNLTKDYMCTLFKKNTGETIIHCLTCIRIGHARQLLILYPEKRVADIAQQCGFYSPSYFGKTFKNIVGMTPEQFRKNG